MNPVKSIGRPPPSLLFLTPLFDFAESQSRGAALGNAFATKLSWGDENRPPRSPERHGKRRRVERSVTESIGSFDDDSSTDDGPTSAWLTSRTDRGSAKEQSTASRLLEGPRASVSPSSRALATVEQATRGPRIGPAPTKHKDNSGKGKHSSVVGRMAQSSILERFWGVPNKMGQPKMTTFLSSPSQRERGSTQGFKNLGNTCYINAGLQALLGLTPLAVDLGRELDARGGKVSSSDRTVTAAVLEVFAQMRSVGSRQGTMDASRIKRAVAQRFPGYYQQDVQDFLEHCLDKLDEEEVGRGGRPAGAVPGPAEAPATDSAAIGDDVVEVGMSMSMASAADVAATDDDEIVEVEASTASAADADVIVVSDDEELEEEAEPLEPARTQHATPIDDSLPEEVLAHVEAAEAAEVGRSEEGPVWKATTLANRNFGSEIVQRRRCMNPACPGSANPTRVYFRCIPLSLEHSASSHGTVASVQSLVDRFFEDEEVEYDCEGCGEPRSTMEYSMARMPRVLCLHIKRFASTGGKIQRPVKLERYVTLDQFCSQQTLQPHMDGLSKQALVTAARATAGPDADSGSSPNSAVNKKLDFGRDSHKERGMSRREREQHEIQKAIEASLLDSGPRDPSTMSEAEQLEWALAESTKSPTRDPAEDTPWRGGEFDGGAATGPGKFSYRLVSLIRHTGSSAGAGHYIADVWNPLKNTWKEYDDALVKEVDEKKIFGSETRARSAYVLFYALDTCLPKLEVKE